MKAAAALLLIAAGAAHADPAQGWELRVPERLEVANGATSTLSIDLALDRGLRVSKDAGMIIDLAPDGGISVKRRRLGRADAVDPDADAPRFVVPVHAEAAGDFTLRVHLRFWLCAQKTCRPIDVRRGVAVTVAAAPPSSSPSPPSP